MSMKNIRYYYEFNYTVYYMNSNDTSILHEETKLDKYKNIKNGYKYFEAFKSYDASHDGLIKYKYDFEIWNNEIKLLQYSEKECHKHAVLSTFLRVSTNLINSLNIPYIKYLEYKFYEKCYNGALISLDEQHINKLIYSYGYDYSSYFPNLLSISDFEIAISEGREIKINELNYDNLQYGIYNCSITTKNTKFNKVFAFSKNSYYTHYDILFAYNNKEKFDIEIKLNTSCNYNALVYDKTIKSSKIFKPWYNLLTTYKSQFPKNKLVKHLFSSLWGYLIRFNGRYFTEDEIIDLDVSYEHDEHETEYKIIDETRKVNKNGCINTTFLCIKTNAKLYDREMARIKPFFTAFQRNFIGQMIIDENIIDKLIRIHTDGIVLKDEHDFTHLNYYPNPEDKTTGLILWYNCNLYKKIDDLIDEVNKLELLNIHCFIN